MKIVFICTGNTCRSPMAEIIAKEKIKSLDIKKVKVSSMGICAIEGTKTEPNAINALKMLNIIAKPQKAKMLNPVDLQKANLIITMTENQKSALTGYKNVKSINEFTGQEINDPYKQSLQVYITAAKQINEAVEKIFNEAVNIG